MTKKTTISRRLFLQGASATTAAGVLAACAPAIKAPATVEPIALTMLSPDRELENAVNQEIMDAFNAAMKVQGKPYTMSMVKGAATDNDYRTKMTVDAACGHPPRHHQRIFG